MTTETTKTNTLHVDCFTTEVEREMTNSELAEQEDKDGNSIGELPVCIAHQQSWPLAEKVAAVTVSDRDGMKVWLAASPSHDLDYAPRNAWEGGIEGIDWEDED